MVWEGKTWIWCGESGCTIGEKLSFKRHKPGYQPKLEDTSVKRWKKHWKHRDWWKNYKNNGEKNSLRFRSLSAAAANGFDFAINGFNSIINSIVLNKEMTGLKQFRIRHGWRYYSEPSDCSGQWRSSCFGRGWTNRLRWSRSTLNSILCSWRCLWVGRWRKLGARRLCQDILGTPHSHSRLCRTSGYNGCGSKRKPWQSIQHLYDKNCARSLVRTLKPRRVLYAYSTYERYLGR